MALDPRIPLSVQPPAIKSTSQINLEIAKEREAEQQQQMNALKLQDAQQQMDAQKMLDAAYSHYVKPDGSVDYAGLANEVARTHGHLVPGILKTGAELQETAAKARKAKVDAETAQADLAGGIGSAMQDMLDKGATPEDVAGYGLAHIAALRAGKLIDDSEASALTAKLDPSNPDQLKQTISAMRAASSEQSKVKLAQSQSRGADVLAQTREAELGAIPAKNEEAIAKAEQAKQVTTGMQGGLTAKDRAELALTGQQRAIAAGQLAVAQRRENREASQEVGVSLTPEGLDLAAENFAKTGQLPPMGLGKAGAAVRSAIINRAANLHPDLDLASARAGFGADQGSLKQLQSRRDAISAFENTALKNIDIFLGTAGKIVDTGSPLANSLARAASGKVLGSPNQAAYDAARQVALNEVARITSNPNLTGVLSDSARKEVEAFNPNSATLAQSVAVMRVLKQDMANRAVAYDQQLDEVKARIKAGSGTTPAVDKNDPLGILK